MPRNAWLTPGNVPPTKFYSRRILVPADEQYVAIVSGALLELTAAYNFEQFGTATPEECADTFAVMYYDWVASTPDAPFWSDEDNVDSDPKAPWYETLSDWIIEGFLAISGFPQAAIVYSTSVPKIRFALRTGNLGALFRVLLNNLEMYTGDSYAPITGLFGQTLDLNQFASDNGLGAPPWELRIEHNGSGPNIPVGQTAYLSVVRKKLQDEIPVQFRQTDPCLLEFSEDGGTTWATAADLSLCVPASQFPIGAIMPMASSTVPSGWLACDGAAVSRTTYGDLFLLIGTAYGVGDGSTTFNVPDLRGRTPLGAGQGSGLTNRVLASNGGAETHTLSTNEIAAHGHVERASFGNSPFYQTAKFKSVAGATSFNGVQPFAFTADTAGDLKTEDTGGGAAHANMQPWIAVEFMIKT